MAVSNRQSQQRNLCSLVSGETGHRGPLLSIRPQRAVRLHFFHTYVLVPRDHHAGGLLLGFQGGDEAEAEHGANEQHSFSSSDKQND